ncbi:MAG: serine hydrolase [Bacteroidota bacterium]
MHRWFTEVLRAWILLSFMVPGVLPGQERGEDYRPVIATLREFIQHEMEDKNIPALSIALVDDQTIIWAEGFGYADEEKKIPATYETSYRAGSVSKLFTDIAIMQLVEQGEIDLDAPMTRYLPAFKPRNPFQKQITLRHLMSHRSGLVRESPVGHYFDPGEPSLAATVQILNRTTLVYKPGTRTKYSNAGVATVGLVLETLKEKKFEQYIQVAVLDRLGMEASSFVRTAKVRDHLAQGTMWTVDGRTFPAPTFPLGTGPAGNLYSNVIDLGKFLAMLFNGGIGETGRLLNPQTLAQMWVPQFVPVNQRSGFGIGFAVSDFEGYLRVGHGGAVYGFSTELAGLPEEKLGIVLMASVDAINPVLERIANHAFHFLLAYREGEARPVIQPTFPIHPKDAADLAGLYANGGKSVRLMNRNGTLLAAVGSRTGMKLRLSGSQLVTDDRLSVGMNLLMLSSDALVLGPDTLIRTAEEKPSPVPDRWKGLLGEYGWDHNILYILEKEGKLYCLIEWFNLYPLREITRDEFAFPEYGLYHGEKLHFRRDNGGNVTGVEAASVLFQRRAIDGEKGGTFKIRPLKPIEALRAEALAAQPPREEGEFYKSDLVDLSTLDSTIRFDIRYASKNNFMSSVFYSEAKAFLQRPAAEALVHALRRLKDHGYGLMIHDGYRPWYVTKMFWDATPEDKRLFVADPSKGSRHNRGCAVDLTLYDLKTGKPVDMVSGYDEFSDRAFPEYPGGTSLQRWHRELLRSAMEAEGFDVYEWEWWHFDYRDWRKYPIGTVRFEEIREG